MESQGELIRLNKKNKNGRIYPAHIFLNELKKYQEKIDQNMAMGELGHPDSIDISFNNVSHLITECKLKYSKVPRKKKKMMKKFGTYQKDIVMVKYKILDTPKGIIAKDLIDNLVPSPRGIGSVDENGVVNEDYKLLSIDLIQKSEKS